MQDTAGGGGAMAAVMMVVWLGVLALVIAGMWKVFTKAGRPGWASIVPIYNVIVMLDIAGQPTWMLFLFLIPIVNLYPAWLISSGIARAFAKDTGYAVGLLLLGFVFYPMLGLGSAQYIGNDVERSRAAA